MAHLNEREYLRQFLAEWPVGVSGRVLNIGAAHGDIDYASLFAPRPLVGVDQEANASVDIVCDLTGECAALEGERFAAILCCSVLEHCQQPWKMAENLVRHLVPNGLLYVTVPWIWRFHPYPSDYWRMSVEGVKLLFPTIAWKRIAYATQAPGEFLNADQSLDGPPWRQMQGPRVLLVTQFVCMIGRAA